jgi:hypothetical protein
MNDLLAVIGLLLPPPYVVFELEREMAGTIQPRKRKKKKPQRTAVSVSF